MLTTTFWILVHPFAVNVNTYVTFTGLGVVLISTSLITPLEPDAPALEIPVTIALVQLYTTPVVIEDAVYKKLVLEQTAFGVNVLDKTGDGFTITDIFWEVIVPLIFKA